MAGGRRFVGDVRLLAVDADEVGRECLTVRGQQNRLQRPVLARGESADLAFAIDNDPDGHRLHAPGRKPGPNLAPEQRTEGVAVEPIDDPPRLLGVDEMPVDGARMRKGLADRGLGDLAEGHTAGLRDVEAGGLGDVPRDRLAFAIEVGREVDEVGLSGSLRNLADLLAAVRNDLIGRLEVVLDIDAELVLAELLRQVSNMSIGGQDLVARTEVALDRFRLGGRLHDHQVVVHRGGV